jgi:hypothetical protein
VLWVPISSDAPDLENGCGHRDLNQCDDRRSGHGRRGRMHHDTKRAMICVGGSLVGVRDLRNRQQGEQNQTHNRDCRKTARPRASVSLRACLELSKQRPLLLRIH